MKRIYSPLAWYAIPGYEGYYEINELGTVRSVDRVIQTINGTRHLSKKYQMSRMSKEGYVEIRLCRNGLRKTFQLHRLLAMTFIPKPFYKNEVNHIDGNKINNSLENLEWVTHRENIIHAFQNGLYKTFGHTSKNVIDHCSGKEFSSAKKASEHYSLRYSTLKNYLNGRRPNPTCLQYAIK